MKTTILLDVDGVLNAISKNGPSQNTGWTTWEKVNVLGYSILYSPELIDEINSLSARDDVQFVWLTTWCHHAPQSLAPALGLDCQDWPVWGDEQNVIYEDTQTGWWKLDIAQLFWQGDSHLIWIDDDLDYMPQATKWAKDAFIISPTSAHGLRKKDIMAIHSYLDNLGKT